MRIYLYLIAGITSALLGWNLGQFVLADLGLLQSAPEIVLFPCVAISLAMGMVLNEIFISSPTRPKLCLRKAIIPFFIALGLGLIFGLFAGAIAQILFLPSLGVSATIVRIVGWLLIGVSVGLAEGFTWRWETVEAGDKKRFRQRFITSVIGATAASLIAAFLFEVLRSFWEELPSFLRLAEDPIGFSLLGLFLGLTFSLTSSPSYLVALRAGAGFEFTGNAFIQNLPKQANFNQVYPSIDTSVLTFVSDSTEDRIEEGLSIKLPTKGSFKIGSGEDCHIKIPSLPEQVATLEIKSREAVLIPSSWHFNCIEINGEPLTTKKNIVLKHNYLISFHPIIINQNQEQITDKPKDNQESKNNQNNQLINQESPEIINIDYEKNYRFVYYNRFFDPQG
jgi:uncharacterized membrane protein YidH (DUF202 family)